MQREAGTYQNLEVEAVGPAAFWGSPQQGMTARAGSTTIRRKCAYDQPVLAQFLSLRQGTSSVASPSDCSFRAA